MSNLRRHTPRPHHGGEDNVTTSRIEAVAIALSIAFGFAGGAGSTQGSAKDQTLSGAIAFSKRMADGKEWTTANLHVNTSSSYCYDDAEPNCRRYGRLYTWESAQRGCQSLGDGWRLPTDDEWRQLAKHYGGLGNDSPDKGRAAYTALLSGGTSGFNAILGGNRSIDGQYDRLEAHGIYWTVSENDPITAPLYNFGKGSQALLSWAPGPEADGSFRALRQGVTAQNSGPREPMVVERIRASVPRRPSLSPTRSRAWPPTSSVAKRLPLFESTSPS